MKGQSIKHQLLSHFVALLSLAIAVIALCYTAWREAETDKNRTQRLAGFEVLKNLGELQIIVNQFYQPEPRAITPYAGWGHIALIGDLSQLLPSPVPQTTAELLQVWRANWEKSQTNETSVTLITEKIDSSRKVVLNSILHLR